MPLGKMDGTGEDHVTESDPEPTRPCTVADCHRTVRARGLCNAHYLRQRRSGELPLVPLQDLAVRFWAKVGPPDENGCRPWLACRNELGYGEFRVDGESIRAQGLAWRLTYHGPTKPGAEIFRHSCDHTWCAEPSHVYPGTRAENSADMVTRGRSPAGERSGARKHPELLARGEQHGMAKLTAQAVRQIRFAVIAGESRVSVADRHDISRAHVGSIVTRRTWAWLS